MKKLKIYILALLVPILLMGCVEKGKPNVNIDTGTVTVNVDLSDSIRANLSYILHIYNTGSYLLSEKISPTLQGSAYLLLKEISEAYLYGGVTSSQVDINQSQIIDKKSDFFKANSLLTYENMIATDSNITKQITAMQQETNPNGAHIANLEAIQSKLLEIKSSILDKLKTNLYYFELDESILLTGWLNSQYTADNPKISYMTLLKNYNVLDNSTLQEKYNNLIRVVNNDLDILNNVNTITDINQLLSLADPKVTTKYSLKTIYSSTQLTDLKTKLSNLKSLYQNYKTNAANISSAEQQFYLIEREYLQTLSADYYYKIRMSGTTLTIETLNNYDLLTDLNRIYSLQNPQGVDLIKLKIIINNLDYSLKRIRSYDALNLKDSYSACVLSGQMVQMLKDNRIAINTWIQNNPKP